MLWVLINKHAREPARRPTISLRGHLDVYSKVHMLQCISYGEAKIWPTALEHTLEYTLEHTFFYHKFVVE